MGTFNPNVEPNKQGKWLINSPQSDQVLDDPVPGTEHSYRIELWQQFGSGEEMVDWAQFMIRLPAAEKSEEPKEAAKAAEDEGTRWRSELEKNLSFEGDVFAARMKVFEEAERIKADAMATHKDNPEALKRACEEIEQSKLLKLDAIDKAFSSKKTP